MVRDMVCGMEIDPATVAAQADYHGRTYYFCSAACHVRFLADPERYAGAQPSGADRTSAFQHHMIEMVLSMLIPMSLLAISFNILLPSLGIGVRPGVSTPSGLIALAVALLGMTVPMIVLMLIRGHTWWHIWEMTIAMFVPLVVIMPVVRMFVPRSSTGMNPSVMLPIAFVAMTGGMIVLMLMRKTVYAEHRH